MHNSMNLKIDFFIKTNWFWMRWTIRIKRRATSRMYDSKLTCYSVVFIHNLVAKSDVCNALYLTSTSSMCKTRKLEYQWHATQCLSYSSWSHMAHVEALSWPPCVDWSQWRVAGSRRMYSSSLSHTGGTCTKWRCARTPRMHSFPRTHTPVHGGTQFCTKIHPMW